ncbi:MAG TPA: hemolysin family protein [Roseiflexaceae bacterium]
MWSSLLVEVLLIVVLMLANGFFAASEIAIVSARKGRLEQRAEQGSRGAAAALELAENPNRFLSTVQVGITVIGTFAAAFGGANLAEPIQALLNGVPALAPFAEHISLAIVVLLISYLSLILGELVPKRLALQSAEGVSVAIAPLMRGLSRLASPIVSFLTGSTELVLRLLGRHQIAETPVTEDDIIALVREGAEEGTVEAAEQELIANVFSVADRTVRSLMTPRTQIVAVALDTPLAEALSKIAESGYSRVPVYEDSLDRIAGILYIKDLLQSWGRPETPELKSLLRPPLYLLESQRALVAFQQLKQQRGGQAIVIDEYGQVAGLITLEDILEEMVGDIADEYDEVGESIVRRDDGSYLIDGLLSFADVQERLGLPEVTELTHGQDFETVAGFVLALLGRIPRAGERVQWQGYTFEVVDMDGRRIDKVLLQPPPQPAGAQSEGVLASGAVLPPVSPDPADDRAAEASR